MLVAPAALCEPLNGQTLIAQQVVDGLPPPPFIMFDQAAPQEPLQIQPAQPVEAQPAAPTAPSGFRPSEPLYLVYVNGDSPLLLSQVRRVESQAIVQNYDGRQIIQAGVFNDPSGAERQAEVLESEGIGAEVVAVSPDELPQEAQMVSFATPSTLPPPELLPYTTTPREIEFGQQPGGSGTPIAQVGAAELPDDTYYVAIPAHGADLSDVGSQVVRLVGGVGGAAIAYERRNPLGPHVLVGPFVNRSAASRWTDYFRDFGLDARVYYR